MKRYMTRMHQLLTPEEAENHPRDDLVCTGNGQIMVEPVYVGKDWALWSDGAVTRRNLPGMKEGGELHPQVLKVLPENVIWDGPVLWALRQKFSPPRMDSVEYDTLWTLIGPQEGNYLVLKTGDSQQWSIDRPMCERVVGVKDEVQWEVETVIDKEYIERCRKREMDMIRMFQVPLV